MTGHGAYPTSCTMGAGFFPGVKRPGRGVDHPHPSSAEVKEGAELYLYSPYMPLWLGQKQLCRFIPKILCLNCYLFMSFLTRLNLYQAPIEQLVIILGLSEPEDERVRAFEASGAIDSTTQGHIAEDLSLQLHLCESLLVKSNQFSQTKCSSYQEVYKVQI
jgi:hypothetical protein